MKLIWTHSTRSAPTRKSCSMWAMVGRGRGSELASLFRPLLKTIRRYGYCQWPLIYKADCKLIGYCSFVNIDDAPEIGWRLAREYWGRGLATEAAQTVFKHGTETLALQRMIATVHAADVASIRVIEKLGMMLMKRFDRDGREVMLYSMDMSDLGSCRTLQRSSCPVARQFAEWYSRWNGRQVSGTRSSRCHLFVDKFQR